MPPRKRPEPALPEAFDRAVDALAGRLEKFHDRGFEFLTERVIHELGEDPISEIHYRGVRVDLLDAVIPFFRRVMERARECCEDDRIDTFERLLEEAG